MKQAKEVNRHINVNHYDLIWHRLYYKNIRLLIVSNFLLLFVNNFLGCFFCENYLNGDSFFFSFFFLTFQFYV